MSALDATLSVLATISLVVVLIRAYLVVMKLWSRKHEAAVAASQSVVAQLLGILTAIPFVILFASSGEVQGAIAVVINNLALSSFKGLVGVGWWVPSDHGARTGLFRKLREALSVERGEVGQLATAFKRPKGADIILQLLHQVAMIDLDLDDRERAFIERFAREWRIDYRVEDLTASAEGGAGDFVALRATAARYVALDPPPTQCGQLRDALEALVNIDDEVTEAEKLIMAEILGMLDAHLSGADLQPPIRVIVVPQDDHQIAAIRGLLREPEPIAFRGGSAYVVGAYFAREYASIVCDEHRSLNFFTVIDESQ